MSKINPHLHFNGNAEEAFLFYQSVIGGTITKILRFKDIGNPAFSFPNKEANKIMQIVLSIENSSALMGSDVPEFMGTVNENENRSKIYLQAESKEEADKLYLGLSFGGDIEMPMSTSPWGSYFAMFRDKYGIEWMIDFTPNF
ncbi:VOC family protein [Cytophagaceae bacterium 50C-KIRBA]|uniref:VOC family protein n=1 Tax=Aquirufa beregesia TaxID=2516556 RepID=A0ABX0EXZ6_9BACT|nr:VOC family protein [Aquirufa beregesia]NGZ43604.1 VOC family protein [Aquirufa beregesia]